MQCDAMQWVGRGWDGTAWDRMGQAMGWKFLFWFFEERFGLGRTGPLPEMTFLFSGGVCSLAFVLDLVLGLIVAANRMLHTFPPLPVPLPLSQKRAC